MPSYEVKEEDREGWKRPSCCPWACPKSPTDQTGQAGWGHPPISHCFDVSALMQVGETLVVPEGTLITTMIREAFDNILLKETSYNYDNYGLVSR